ncbi:retrotransposon protein, putative, Ty1-copia subclass [Cucumis melo var. makuwa]|uniref:Retrotransposon protein, putative, Ty1-copia subclass n=1 Tax=Cucumis melo var. makuwa TaxID=1194695 RepID=A0A5D3BTL6_CUCMM|nr:retrotransposon protein, putative, Ty1-copia subclass [Cucumis melo var. makuwa]TYK02525.1 retrotransposon protein, putative, Ty1-copia subclass [Cucumis melo var. makuwa]TYK19037.1 retrotransposon protein, putative, Ty1-copia subclass [Cucumis melo var. makuwa]
MDEMTYSTILLYLSNEVLGLVDEATTTGELWKKLRSLYLTKGTGSVQITTHYGMVGILINVRYVQKLKRNLISLGELDRSYCTIKSENGVMKVTKGSAAIASDKVTDMSMLWHKRLAHVSERSLQTLSQQGLLGRVKDVEVPFCEHCIMDKSTGVKFGKGKHTTKGILDYVHSDLWGPTKEASMGGSRYFISIIDDFSRKVWMYPLKQKDEAFGKFLEWKKQVKNQTCRKREAAQTMCYLIDRSPSTALNLKTPQEVWTGKAPSLDHLRVFVCTSYAHVKDGKLNKRALKCMFIGYPQGVKGYKLWILIDEGAFIEESSSNNDLQNYQLTGDRAQRERHAPIRYGYADLVAYALTCATDSIEAEPLTFEEAIISDLKK